MSGVIIVAPADARWPVRAESVLADAKLFTARLYEPALLPLLVRSGGVCAVAIDVRSPLRSGAVLRECVAADPAVRVVLVHEAGPMVNVAGWRSQRWPDEAAVMVALVAPRSTDAL